MNPSSVKKFLDRGMGLGDGRKKDGVLQDIALDPKELRQVLQRDLFGEEEEVKVVAQVRKTKKKKNKQTKSEDSLLCITMNTKRGQKVRIQVVKYTHGSCVIKQTWKLEELHRIEFYEEESSDTGFSLYFDKVYNWTAFDTYQRNDFVARLWKLCEDNLKSVPQTSIDIMELRFLASEDDPRKLTTADNNFKDIASSYKDLTAAEEKELEDLLNSCVSGVTDIDELSNHLNKRLNELEEQNIYEIIESELAVKEVLNRLNTSFSYLDTVDKWLINYDSQLKNMQQYIEHIISKNNRMEVVARNQRKLLEEMEKFLKKFQLDETYRKILKSGGLAIDGGLDAAIKAAKALDALYKAYDDLKPETKQMKAVKEKMEEYEVVRSEFAGRFYQFIQETFSKIAVEAKARREKDENFVWNVESHTAIFKQLLPYKDLVHWFKRKEEPAKFDKLLQSYSHFLRSVYKRSIKDFFSKTQKYIITDSKDHKILAFTTTEKVAKTPKAPALPKSLEKMTADKIFYYCLNVFVPIMLAEQNFCIEFFDLTVQKYDPNNIENSVKDGLSSVLEALFEGTSNECLDIIETADKLGHFYTLTILVYVCQYTTKYESQCPYLVQVLNGLERRAIVLFNKFIDDQITSIKETQISTKRCGIINWFSKFPLFVDYMEQCISGSKEVRTFADSTYHKLILSMFTWLNQLGEQDPVPKFKYITRLENFHCFAREMTQRNIPCMAEYIQQATDSYKANRTSFIELIVKDKFKTLTEYFDGIDALLVTLPAEEIQFQQSHSKQALAKYNSKNTSDKLDKIFSSVFKKIVKNLCIEEGLTTEVWDALTQYLVAKYQHFEDLVKRCYKGQQLSLSSKQLQELCKSQVKKHLGEFE